MFSLGVHSSFNETKPRLWGLTSLASSVRQVLSRDKLMIILFFSEGLAPPDDVSTFYFGEINVTTNVQSCLAGFQYNVSVSSVNAAVCIGEINNMSLSENPLHTTFFKLQYSSVH